jgi:hypothetical protein
MPILITLSVILMIMMAIVFVGAFYRWYQLFQDSGNSAGQPWRFRAGTGRVTA